jgi:hypothetical protein
MIRILAMGVQRVQLSYEQVQLSSSLATQTACLGHFHTIS